VNTFHLHLALHFDEKGKILKWLEQQLNRCERNGTVKIGILREERWINGLLNR
jgi:hypothetical protein